MRVYEISNGFGLENLRLADRPDPKPGQGEVRLKVLAVSLNYRDLLVIKGQYNPKMPLPRIPVSDGVGEVVELGPGVTRVKVGQRVAGLFMPRWLDGEIDDSKSRLSLGGPIDGMLAEQVVLSEESVIDVPAYLTPEEAATLPCAALTAWNAVVEAGKIKPGETVLVQGTGGVSIFAMQFASLAGARVIITSSSDEKLAAGKTWGASDGINYRTNPEWGDEVRKLTGGRGVDHVIEVGGAATLGQSLRAVRTGGHIALIGVLGGYGQFNPVPILMKAVRVSGIFVGSRAMFESMNRALALHELSPAMDRCFSFDQTIDALKHMESGAHFGKITIRIA